MRVNPNFEKLPGQYLFAEVARRVRDYAAAHPQADLIRLGIGDVTRPLAPAVVEALKAAADEMLSAATFHGYGPDFGYDFLIDAIREQDYAPRSVSLAFENMYLNREIFDTQSELIHRLGEVVESRSQDAGFHVRRMAELSFLLAKLAGLRAQGVTE